MSKWMVVLRDGAECLFGFAERHAVTGGLSWTVSSPIVELDEAQATATTASGRTYRLGNRIDDHELDEEGTLARSVLLNGLERTELGRCDLGWLMSCKWARHLGLTAPRRHDCDAIAQFLAAAENSYLNKMFRPC